MPKPELLEDGAGRQPASVLSRLLLGTLLAIALAACGKPVPPDKANYVGEWQDANMYLRITRDGKVQYKRAQGGSTASIDAPLKTFHGNNFEVGIGPMSTVFTVTEPPHEVFGKWKMTVDGVELTRTNDLSAPR